MLLQPALRLQGLGNPLPVIASPHARPRSLRAPIRASLDPSIDAAASLLPGIEAAQLAVPALAGAALAVAAAKFVAYSQLEVVRTAMLSRHVKPGGARVFMAGGTTRDLFYLPQGTVQVAVAAADLKAPFWEQAGMQAGVPVRGIVAAPGTALAAAAGAAYDSVVLFDALGAGEDLQEVMNEAWRALKPGGMLIFFQKIGSGSPLAAAVRVGGAGGAPADPGIGDAVVAARAWDFAQWDEAAGALDPHAVGVAVKPLEAAPEEGFSADGATFKEVLKAEQRRKKGGAGGGGAKGKKGFGGGAQ